MRRPGLLALVVVFFSLSCSQIDDLLHNPSATLTVQKFTATPQQVVAGGTVTLSWEVSGADAVEIDNGVGAVKAKGAIGIRVDRTTSFNLTARSGSTSTAASTVVAVSGSLPAPILVPGGSPSPTPSPSPTTSPKPSPTPSPTPSPSPTPVTSNACKLPRMPECGAAEGPTGVYGCCTTKVSGWGEFGELVDKAQDIVERDHPELFKSGKVKTEEDYVAAVVKELLAMGVCAAPGGPTDELGVKTSNSSNEQFDVVLSNMSPRRGGFVARCSPARF